MPVPVWVVELLESIHLSDRDPRTDTSPLVLSIIRSGARHDPLEPHCLEVRQQISLHYVAGRPVRTQKALVPWPFRSEIHGISKYLHDVRIDNPSTESGF